MKDDLDKKYSFTIFIDLHDYYNNIGNDTSEFLNLKDEYLESRKFTYRVLNSWDKNELLECKREENTGWRKFSLIDKTWLYLIQELRKFNFSIKQIKRVKDNLGFGSDKFQSTFPMLELHTISCLLNTPTYILIFHDGQVEFESCNSEKDLIKVAKHDNALKINMNNIVQKALPNQDLTPKFRDTMQITETEKKLITLLRTEQWEEVKIKGKEGNIELVEFSRNEPVTDAVLEKVKKLQSGSDFQEISIKMQNGKTVNLNQKKKIKMG
ncbi:MerR family transcriptional regulator [Marinifilum flexuosum]|uniref:MerR family transcriptional regulator n=1 Tax=Marinifilum flexuosum TaxID=1117708 RepID=UPI002493C961|nr:MerR family transcriptional regulator [Marinifilum flexuosum]